MSQKQNQINIELSDEISKGKYANLAMIAHSSSEFVIDFIQLMPGVPKAKVNSRIIITPCLLYTSPSPRDRSLSRMPSSA